MDGEASVIITFVAMISLNPTYDKCRVTDQYCKLFGAVNSSAFKQELLHINVSDMRWIHVHDYFRMVLTYEPGIFLLKFLEL